MSGAGAFRFKTSWVNRAGVSWDKLTGKPDHIVKSISEVSNLLAMGLNSVGQRMLNVVIAGSISNGRK